MNIKKFGGEVIEKLLAGKGGSIKILREQFKNAKVSKIEYNGAGFFIHYHVNPKIERLGKKNLEIGGICKINKNEFIYDILLFIRNGAIDFLEGSIFDEGEFPKKIDYYEFEPSKEENMRKLSKKKERKTVSEGNFEKERPNKNE